MSKVRFNSDNFMNQLKKGLSFVVAAATVGALGGCNSSSSSMPEENVPSSSLVGDMFAPTTEPVMYDFESGVISTEPVTTEVFGWSETKEKVLAHDDEAWELAYTGQDIVSGLSKNKYGAVICETADGFGDIYYRIVDSEGNYLSDDKIEMMYTVDDHTLLYSKTSEVDRDYKENITYTIFDQLTGTSVDVDAINLYSYNGYLVKTTYSEEEGYKYELLSKEGTNVTDVVYDGAVYDDGTNILYLSKDGVTEALDTNTLKVRKIDGVVRNASNGYVSVQTKVDDESVVQKFGVLYLTDVEMEPTLMIPYAHEDMYLIIDDAENPLFVCCDWNEETLDYERRIVDKNGQVVVEDTADYSFFIDCYGTDLIKAYRKVAYGDESIYLYDVFNSKGEKVIGDISFDVFLPIPGTDKAIFKNGENDKYGVMNFAGEYLIMPSFDKLNSSPVYEQQEDGTTKIVDCYLIGRMAGSNNTMVFTKDLEVVATGDFGYTDAEDIALGHHAENDTSKVLTK